MELGAHAVEAARRGGSFALENLHRKGEVNLRTHHDVKLQMDVDTQHEVEAYLKSACPDHAVFGEEGGDAQREEPFQWIIDPIDGTMNYFLGIPHWCSSVAVRHGDTVVAGAVYAPAMDECFSATLGGAAELNGKPIRVSDIDSLAEGALLTGGISRVTGDAERRVVPFLNTIRQLGKVRILGAAALDFCYVACGRVDAMYEHGLKLWDVAAGGLIVQQAGGSLLEFDREDDLTAAYLACNPAMERPLVEVLEIDAVTAG
jgi:myo-inositol-1(or 4)-monophosphatase